MKIKLKVCNECGRPFPNKGQTRHGDANTNMYRVWLRMRIRCNNPNSKEYRRYGGRGIKVCKRWEVYENWLADMGPKPTPKHSIDRIDNDGDYEPSNCRWATRKEQAINRSTTKYPEVLERSKEIGISTASMYKRIKNWGLEEALNTERSSRWSRSK